MFLANIFLANIFLANIFLANIFKFLEPSTSNFLFRGPLIAKVTASSTEAADGLVVTNAYCEEIHFLL